jgi:hypothetical protein
MNVGSDEGNSDEGTDEYRQLARSLRRVIELTIHGVTDDDAPSEFARRITGHLGCEPGEIVPVADEFPPWEQVNAQRGVDAYLAAHGDGDGGGWFGVASGGRHMHEDMVSLIVGPHHAGVALAAASYGTAPTGPDTNTEVVTFGLVNSVAPGGEPVVIGVRLTESYPPRYRLEILATSREAATSARDEIERLMRANDVFRGQVLSFTESEHNSNELVAFLPRPAVTARDIVLPDGVLETIEEHVIGIADWSRELLGAGQHVKRGLLLHGPPGTGKTHTVRYLTARLSETTVILLTGPSMRFIDSAAALARRLQPSMVVLEDVDLIASDREFHIEESPLLFSLLDAMDGVGSAADVTFVLTTNRADILEQALADRPGRVDLAVEIPRPDDSCRARLLAVYARDMPLPADLDSILAATSGVTASFIKELIRRVVLASLRAGDSPPVLDERYFTEVLSRMNGQRESLTRALLGADAAENPRGARI